MQNDALTAGSSHRIDDAAVLGALHRPDAQRIARAFDRVAREDFRALAQFDAHAHWDDYRPAYAVGLVTYDACTWQSGAITEEFLHAAWRTLRGSSRLGWEKVREIVARSWSALACIEREGDCVPFPPRGESRLAESARRT